MADTVRLSRKQLYRRIWSKPRVAVAADLGMSFTALGRLCDRLLIPYPSRDHWSKSPENRATPPPLPKAPQDGPEFVTINSPEGTRSRRTLSRLSRKVRREQIIEGATRLVKERGLANTSVSAVAKALGLSEALIYTYFSSPSALFAEIAKKELNIVYERCSEAMNNPVSHLSGSLYLTSTSLAIAEERGAVLDTLLADPEVRRLVREESRFVRGYMTEIRAKSAMRVFDVPFEIAHAQMHLLFGITVRAGRCLGRGHIDRESALKMCLAIQLGGIDERFQQYDALRDRFAARAAS